MAKVIMRIMDDPRSRAYTALDEYTVCRGSSDECVRYLRKLEERARRRGFRHECGVLRNGAVYDQYKLHSGVVKRFELYGLTW